MRNYNDQMPCSSPLVHKTDTGTSLPRKRKENKCWQESGTFNYKHCPFPSKKKKSAARPLPSHSTEKVNVNLVLPDVEKERMMDMDHLGSGESNDLLLLSQTSVQKNGIAEKVKEMEVIDVTIDSEDEDTDKVYIMERKHTEEPICLCCQSQNGHDSFVISCDQCTNLFHGNRVGITSINFKQMKADGEKWLCAPYIRNESLFIYNIKLVKAVKDHALVKQVPPFPELWEEVSKREEIDCLSELSELEQEIQSANSTIIQTEMLMKEEDRAMRMTRSRTANDFRKKVDELERKERGQSMILATLMENYDRFQEQQTDLLDEKFKLETELNRLREFVCTRMRLDGFSSDLSAAYRGVEELIQQKKHLLSEVKEKLTSFQDKEPQIEAQIQEAEKKKIERTRDLTKLGNDLKLFLDGNQPTTSPNTIAIHLRDLKREQKARIVKFTTLEKRLARISSDYAFDKVHKKKEEWFSVLNDY